MKIIITESQLRKIISESYSEDYLNYLLDKISEEGMDSLNDDDKQKLQDLSNGKEIQPPEEHTIQDDPNEPEINILGNEDDWDNYGDNVGVEQPANSDSLEVGDTEDSKDEYNYQDEPIDAPDIHSMFFNYFPHYAEMPLINGRQWVVEINDEGGDNLKVTDGARLFYISPFLRGNTITVETTKGKNFDLKIDTPPQDLKSMKLFIKSFISDILPLIIQKINKHI